MALPEELQRKWMEAEATGDAIPVGDTVVCDVCNKDYTESSEIGGFIFGSYGYCPSCARKSIKSIQGYGEENHIKAVCPDNQTFADFVREYRGPDAAIRIRRYA